MQKILHWGAEIATIVFIFLVGVPLPAISGIPKAHAQFAAFEVNPAIVAGVVATAGAEVTQSTGTSLKNILDALAWSLAKVTVQSITRSTVNWINSGFNGSPAFISDLNENLRYLGDAVADDFFKHLNDELVRETGFNLNSPFQDQLNQQLRNEFYRTTGSWGINQFYTLNKDSTDPKAFINGDFSQGGFNAFLTASQKPGNNPFSAYKLANDQLFAQIDANVQRRKAELGWGKGFLPWRGSCPQSTSSTLSRAEPCLFNSVKTPGSIIESSLGITTSSPIRQLELADSINEIVAALMGQLVNQVIGPGGVAGLSQPAPGGGPSFLTSATDPSQYSQIAASLSGGVVQNIANDITNITGYRENWQKLLSAAITAQNRCGLRQDISSIIVAGNANTSRADVALIKAADIQKQVQAAAAAPPTSATTGAGITGAVTSYQSFLSDPSVPKPAEIQEAKTESADTGTAQGIRQSIYTRLLVLQQTCAPGAI